MKKKWFNHEHYYALFRRLCFMKLTVGLLMAITMHFASAKDNLSLSQQQVSVSGKVTDAQGGLPGVTVLEKGTQNGTITDPDGNYNIAVENNEAVLLFSSVGYVTTEEAVNGRSVIDVIMTEDIQSLEEIVVVGYGTKKRGELTGSISTVSSADLEKTTNTNLTKSLVGRVPGLIVNDRGGYPGASDDEAVSILIRGQATLGNNNPLIVVDGVPTNSFSFMAPSDIESVTVLKDGAAAIYGARAANGVILVTTKRGQQGKPKINFSTNQTFSAFTRLPEFSDSWQHATYQNEVDTRYGNPLQFTEADIENYRAGTDPIRYPNTDWYALTMNDWSKETRYGLTASGGGESVKYFLSANTVNQGGMYESGDLRFKQYQLRANVDIAVNDYIDFGVDLSGITGKREQPGSPIGRIYKHLVVNLPTAVGQYPNGLYGVGAENGNNPRLMASDASGFNEENNSELRSRFTTKIDLGFLTEGLSVSGNATFTLRNFDGKLFHDTWTTYRYDENTDEYIEVPGFDFTSGNFLSVQDSYFKFNQEYYNAQLNYSRRFGSHSIGGFVAFEQITDETSQFNAYKRDLISSEHPELFAGSDEGQTSDGVSSEFARLNYFGSLSYDFDKKYLLDFTLRRDGSGNFGEGKRFGTFPSVAAGWVVSAENFMSGASSWMSFLKLRASWAQAGNDRVGAFQYLQRYTFGGRRGQYGVDYIFGEDPVRHNAFINANVPNPNITWEKADMKNVGITFSMFNDKLSGDINYFHQKRTDILIQRAASIPDYAALTLPAENLGEVDNFGFESELSYSSTIGALSYNLGGNFTLAKNKVVFLDEAAGVPEWQKREGHSINSYLLYPADGLFKTQEEVNATAAKLPGTLPGDVKYIDTDRDGEITDNDQVRRYTSAVPEIQYGIFGGLTYKGFDFSVLFAGQAKADIEILYNTEGAKPKFLFEERWTPEHVDARYPRASPASDIYNSKRSDIWLHNAAFIRLKNVELAYTIPASLVEFANIRFFARGTNLLTFDHIKHLDPEMQGYEGFIDGLYGPLKSVTLGANIQF